jgi:hypothetical protein
MNRAPLLIAAIAASAAIASAQENDPAGLSGKVRFHLASAYGPIGILESATWAGYLQETDSPREWGQGGVGYGKRLTSTLGYSGLRNTIAFGLDSALHQDPRYHRAGGTGFWRRTGHAFRGTILTHTDSGHETLATWRIGSAYSAAFLSNEWRPDRVNTVARSFTQGTTQIGFDVLANIGFEFLPDVKNKLFHNKR